MSDFLKIKYVTGVSILALAVGISSAASEELLIATWGGGVETVWEQAFAQPFKEETVRGSSLPSYTTWWDMTRLGFLARAPVASMNDV